MKPDQENFDTLRRLLKIKRYEQPPPRYFNDFSSQVIIRIKAGAKINDETVLDRLFLQAPWLQRVFGTFETKPAVAWAFGVAVCALVVSGVVYSETADYSPVYATPQVERAAPTLARTFPDITDVPLALISSTNPAAQPAGSLFDNLRIETQPVGLLFRMEQ